MNTTTKLIAIAAVSTLFACAPQPEAHLYDAEAAAEALPDFAEDTPAYLQSEIGDRVHFAVDQSTLSGEARSTLVAQARWMTTYPRFSAVIEGHADERGTREYNLALGARRASAVRDFLVSHGVADSRLETVTYGKERPVALCASESCYADNRRSVTVVNAGGAGPDVIGADTGGLETASFDVSG